MDESLFRVERSLERQICGRAVQYARDDRKMVAQEDWRENGVVYTPENVARYLARKSVQYMLADEDIRAADRLIILDPAVGEGQLLEAAAVSLSEERRTANPILCGIDIDSNALETARRRIDSITSDSESRFIQSNSLCPYGQVSLLEGWQRVLNDCGLTRDFDFLIANPPWGADVSKYLNQLDEKEYSTLQGQFDTYELFLELATKVVRAGGYFSFIVPDSILNHGKKNIREFLLKTTEIKYIARLGEKIFPGVNRGCMLLICKNGPPSHDSFVDCFRLQKRYRDSILSGEMDFSDAEAKFLHRVPQRRFSKNPYKQFDLDLRESEVVVLSKMRESGMTLSDIVTSTRGIELSSSGKVMMCDHCNTWRPLPKKQSVDCEKCGRTINRSEATKDTIVFDRALPETAPLVTGSNLRRYRCTTSKHISKNRTGINYKPSEVYEPPKILVRKTGVGITAAIDYSSAYTTQVVYILRTKENTNLQIEFVLGLLNSRAYYFFLVKSFGEMEWRSHPYLTQSQILSMPIPDIKARMNRRLTGEISSLLEPALREDGISNQLDLLVESKIAELFGLTKRDYEIIFNTINESENLVPIRDLKKIDFRELLRLLSG